MSTLWTAKGASVGRFFSLDYNVLKQKAIEIVYAYFIWSIMESMVFNTGSNGTIASTIWCEVLMEQPA